MQDTRYKNQKSSNHQITSFKTWLLVIVCFLFLGYCILPAQAVIISNIEPTSLSDTSFIVTWSTTDETSSTEILWGIAELTTTTSIAGSTKFHLAELTDLFPNTTYKYRVKSGSTLFPPTALDPLTFTTLSRPSGQYLFSFAVINDLRYAKDKANTQGAMGIPYQSCPQIITSEVADINEHGVAFTVVNGNLAENSDPASGNQIESELKPKLDNLSGASDLPPGAGFKYLPTPGYEDKQATYSSDWISKSFKPLTTDPGSSESRYGYVAADKNKASIFNYQFKYRYYNFIFLDSIKADGSGLASLEALNNYLAAEPNSKTFIFTSYPAYDPTAAETTDYPIELPTSEISGDMYFSNAPAFRTLIEGYTTSEGGTTYPIVAAVVSGHLGDNYKRDINNISYVRQGPAVGYPTGYSIYRVYSNGYIKTFYKTEGRNGSDKPYYELARDQIVSAEGIDASILTQFWLGSSSMRNFTYTYPFIAGVPPAVYSTDPTSNESTVPLNSSILIRFTKRMSPQDLNNWVTISPSAGAVTASFLDSSRTLLQVQHSQNFTVGLTYTVTVSKTYAKDEGLTPLADDYVYSFDTTGGSVDNDPPIASIEAMPQNVTTDPYPSFIGTVSDVSGVVNVEYRLGSSGTWITAEALDGLFSSTVEAFKISITPALSVGNYQIWLRTTDGAGNTSAEGFVAYSFTVAGENPEISLTIDKTRAVAGDPISATPKVEITVTTANSLEAGFITFDTTRTALTFAKVDSNYYATHEVTATLADGLHGLTIEAFDSNNKGSTFEVYPLYVQTAADVSIQGSLLNYPNPFDPGTQSTAIGYTLSKPANITLSIFDLSGNIIAKKTYSSGQDGGKAGYNEVTWNGRSDAGDYVGNGIYIYLVIVDGKVVQNGKGKIAVFKQ